MSVSGQLMPRRSRSGSTPARRWIIGAGIVLVALGLVLWRMSPRVVVGSSRLGLIQVRLSGVDATISHATFSYGSHSVPLVMRGHRLEPIATLPAGTSGVAHVVVTGSPLLAWVPGETDSVTAAVVVPADPTVATTHVNRLLNSNLVVAFREPVSKVTYTASGHTSTLRLSKPSTSVTLPLAVATPGESGSIALTANATPWESPGSTQKVSWTAIPYVQVLASPRADISSTGTLTVTFSQPLKKPDLSGWALKPSTAGTWQQVNPRTYSFTPSGAIGFGPGALVALTIPGGRTGPEAQTGSYLAHAVHLTWTTTPGSVLRLQQLLAEEGYLPVSWQATNAVTSSNTLGYQVSLINNPPPGSFQWKYPNLPQTLQTLWTPGVMTVVTKGAIMQFERANGLSVDGIAGPQVWKALIQDRVSGKLSPDGYTYISVTQSLPETLELWVNGKLVLKTPANTGIPATPTYLGTYPIYERLTFQVMRGKNPNGVPYADPVHWINYFNGGDAVHSFPRASYGFPQSLGCVELPIATGDTVFHAVHYGTLVTVNPPGVAPAPATVAGSTTVG